MGDNDLLGSLDDPEEITRHRRQNRVIGGLFGAAIVVVFGAGAAVARLYGGLLLAPLAGAAVGWVVYKVLCRAQGLDVDWADVERSLLEHGLIDGTGARAEGDRW